MSTKHLWRDDGEPTGHQCFCVAPGSHNALGGIGPAPGQARATMSGGPSRAYLEDHRDEEGE
jgi:hypothetical protein